MGFLINVNQWLLWTVETMNLLFHFGAKQLSTAPANTTLINGPMLAHRL